MSRLPVHDPATGEVIDEVPVLAPSADDPDEIVRSVRVEPLGLELAVDLVDLVWCVEVVEPVDVEVVAHLLDLVGRREVTQRLAPHELPLAALAAGPPETARRGVGVGTVVVVSKWRRVVLVVRSGLPVAAAGSVGGACVESHVTHRPTTAAVSAATSANPTSHPFIAGANIGGARRRWRKSHAAS